MSRKAAPRKAKKGGKGGKKSFKRRLFWLLVKLFVVFLILLGIYAVYLNREIHSRIDGGKVWQLPAAVYGRQVNLEPDMAISKAEMVGLLEGTQYREVTRITRPGEFTVHANYIDMLRRPFDFPEGKEGQVNARLMFDGNSLSEIKNLDNQRDFGLFRLDPRLITMLQE